MNKPEPIKRRRAIGIIGMVARIAVGLVFLLAALRGYAGCEVLAVSNWLLRRDDQVGCVLFSPLDALEARLTSTQAE